MSGTSGHLSSHIGELYMASPITSAVDLAGIKALAIANNSVPSITDIGIVLGWDRPKIDIPTYGDVTAESIVGQKTPAEFTFSFALEFDNSMHTTILDTSDADDGTLRAFVISLSQTSTAIEYIYLTGRLQTVNVNATQGDAIMVDVTVATTGRRYRFSNT